MSLAGFEGMDGDAEDSVAIDGTGTNHRGLDGPLPIPSGLKEPVVMPLSGKFALQTTCS
jgi:hypothetical protein